MNFRDRPEFPPLVAAVRAGDAAAVGALWDLLEEAGATTADVMTLYALPPEAVWQCAVCACPFYAEGHRATSQGQARCGRCQTPHHMPPTPAEDDSLRPVLAAWADRHGPPGRAAEVRAERLGEGFPALAAMSAGDVGRLRAAARRELKRRVLGLFSEVRVPCRACGGKGSWGGPRGGVGTMWCMPCNANGTVAPADLIPPEPPYPADDPLRGLAEQGVRDHGPGFGVVDGPA